MTEEKGGKAHLQARLQVLEVFLENVICNTVTSTEHAKRKTISARDTV
ncbi:PREDICTED: histone H4-like, partial [Phaethon lepturus]